MLERNETAIPYFFISSNENEVEMLSRSCCHLNLPLVHFHLTQLRSGKTTEKTGGRKQRCVYSCSLVPVGTRERAQTSASSNIDLNQKLFRNLYLQSQDLLKLIPHYSTPLTILAPVPCEPSLQTDSRRPGFQRASASTKLAWSPRQLVLPGVALAGELVPCASWFP